jgi:putative oxidoreductase
MSYLSILYPYGDWALLILRLALGVIFLVHGVPKFKNPAGVAGAIGMPAWFGTVIALFETLGGASVLLGLLTPLGALLIAVIMIGAIYNKSMKWNIPFSKQGIMGWEFDLILLAAAIVLMSLGAGVISVDAML